MELGAGEPGPVGRTLGVEPYLGGGGRGLPGGGDLVPLGGGALPRMCDRSGLGSLGGARGGVQWEDTDSPGGRRPRLGPGVPGYPSSCASSRQDAWTTGPSLGPALSPPRSPIAAHAPFRSPAPPRRRPATANPASSVSGEAALLPPRSSRAAAPERGHWTCRARRTETTTPGRQYASAHARCGALEGTSGTGKRRSVRRCERNAGIAHARGWVSQ